MAQFLALAASVASIVLPGAKPKASATQKLEKTAPYSAFSLGVVAGAGLATFIMIEIKHHRIRERMRCTFWSWLKYIDEQRGNEEESRSEEQAVITSDHLLEQPISVKYLESRCIGESSLLQVLVDPNNSLTSTLHSVMITLKPGKCMKPMKAKGVELYYILAGAGNLSRNGDEGSRMVVGDVVTVNPWTLRFMSNQGREDLVFLRVSDSGNDCNQPGFDVVGNIDPGENYLSKFGLRKGYDKVISGRKKLLKYLSSTDT